MNPAVSVVIPAYNSAQTLERTLDALSRQDLADVFEVIVVDDGSTDGTREVVRHASFPVKLLTQDHQGPGPARNLGAAEAGAVVIAFIDADCFPTSDWLRQGLAAMGDADLVQGAVRPDPVASRHPLERTLWVVEESGLYETANLFVRREVFERLGGFEDWLPAVIGKPLAEDVWLGWRLRRAGGKTTFASGAVVYHAIFSATLTDRLVEGARLYHFPFMAAKMPELRDALFYHRLFLSRHTALFDLAVISLALGVLTRSPLPLISSAPYAWKVGRQVVGWRRHALRALAGAVLEDAVGLVALLAGCVRTRSPVL